MAEHYTIAGLRAVLTVGHSNSSLEDFLGCLQKAGADHVIDVRRLPGSRRYPWFDQDALAGSLHEAGVGYVRIPELTGRRNRQHEIDPGVNGFWENQSFHNYADYALSQEFRDGLAQLGRLGANAPTLMCSEAVWWRCHRRIIADHLLAWGVDVQHVMGAGKLVAAKLTEGAVVDRGSEHVVVKYPVA